MKGINKKIITATSFGVVLVLLLTILGSIGVNPLAALLKRGDYLLNLVNQQNDLGNYAPSDLVSLEVFGARDEYLREEAYDNLLQMNKNMSGEGLGIEIISAYRSRAQQESIHADYSRRYGEQYADRISAEAGHSEHQLGVTIDFGIGDSRFDLRSAFGDTPQGIWLEENAWKYGFTLSYPKDREHITGFIYEPWHYRYIGKDAAREWRASGYTLVEYLAQKPQFYDTDSLKGNTVRVGIKPEIYYITQSGYKRHLPSPEAFLSYEENTWSKVLSIDADTLSEFPDVKIIHLEEDPDIYLIEGGIKRHIMDIEALNILGYGAEEVAPVSEVEFNDYEKGEPIYLEILYDVPFTAQAPLGNWDDPRQQLGCEEASALMAVYWAQGKTLTLGEAEREIIAISEYEKATYGEFRDTSAQDTVNWILKDYFQYDNVDLFYDITTEDIKRELIRGNVVIVPVNGQKLGNPFYTPPGPDVHMFVVIGYDAKTKEFIVNDPGTRRGKNFRYTDEVLAGAMYDYETGLHEPVPEIRTAMIVVRPDETLTDIK